MQWKRYYEVWKEDPAKAEGYLPASSEQEEQLRCEEQKLHEDQNRENAKRTTTVGVSTSTARTSTLTISSQSTHSVTMAETASSSPTEDGPAPSTDYPQKNTSTTANKFHSKLPSREDCWDEFRKLDELLLKQVRDLS